MTTTTKTPWYQNHTLITGILAVIISLAFLAFVAPTVQSYYHSVFGQPIGSTSAIINSTSATVVLQYQWENTLVYIGNLLVTSLPVSILAAFAWTLFGYVVYKAGDNEVEYDLTKLTQTITWFSALITPLSFGLGSVLIPTVTGSITVAATITTVLMAIKSIINQAQTTAQPTTAPATPATPTA
jgi:hypothetical protein